MNFQSQLVFADTFPFAQFDLEKDLLILDSVVDRQMPEIAKKFRYVYRVQAGESLKNLSAFADHVEKVLELWNQPLSRQSRIVSCGGGSVGDFSGFLASILKRGLRLCQCPTTWLSAIDSAHGGKTALNVNSVKNQVGTFYPAESVVLVKDLLFMQNEERAREGLSEMIKISLVHQPSFFNDLKIEKNLSDLIWKNLELAIRAKNQIVEQDPLETKGLRKILNLGHTLGHVMESYYQVSHGESVQQGLYFAIEWSSKCGLLPDSHRDSIFRKFHELGSQSWLEKTDFQPMPARETVRLAMQDKKMNQKAQIDFVFLSEVGVAKVIPVSIDDLIFEA
ncbi:3-dehydroquinate synthase, partial [bacterium]|nr:3-dehydroquinate synthase [bacterium]